MRTLLLIATVLAFVLSSCNRVENLKGPIESLATQWDNTTALLTGFINTLQTTQENLQDQFAKMIVPEGLHLNEGTRNQVESLKAGYQEQLGGLAGVSQTVSEFVGEWQDKAGVLSSLKEGLVTGSLNADAVQTVRALEDTVSDAEGKIEEWGGDMDDIKENTTTIFEEFSALVANAQGN